MTTIEYVEKEQKEVKSKCCPFNGDASKLSGYTRDGKELTWQEVTDLVAGLMQERGIVVRGVADFQRKLPKLVFMLLAESKKK